MILNIRNFHRAAKVRPVEEPQSGEWEWRYGAVVGKGFMDEISSLAVSADGTEKEVRHYDGDLNQWEVTEWAYERNFEDLFKQGVDSFYMTSHTPEKRALYYIRMYENTYNEDIAKMPESMHEEYFQQFRAKVIDLFAKHSRCMSSAITGPARFPTERNRRNNEVYDRAAKDFDEWRERQLKKAERMIEASKPQEQKDAEAFEEAKRSVKRSLGLIVAIDLKKDRGYSRSLIVSNLYNRLETMSRNLSPDIFGKVMDYIREVGEASFAKGGKPIFTNRHKVWKLAEEAEKRRQAEAEREALDDVEIDYGSCKVIKCYSEERVQIFHDTKPDKETIARLKRHGFRWSPNNGCWQRQLTSNGIYAAAAFVAGEEASADEQRRICKEISNAK